MRAQFEKLLAIIAIAIVVVFFFEKLDKLIVVAERESVQQTISTVRVAVKFYSLQKIISGKGDDLRNFDYKNPIKMMAHPPINYVGEYNSKTRQQVSPGNWFFDIDSKHLVYKASNNRIFKEGDRKSPVLKYVLRFVNEGSNNGVQQDRENALSLRLLGVLDNNSV